MSLCSAPFLSSPQSRPIITLSSSFLFVCRRSLYSSSPTLLSPSTSTSDPSPPTPNPVKLKSHSPILLLEADNYVIAKRTSVLSKLWAFNSAVGGAALIGIQSSLDPRYQVLFASLALMFSPVFFYLGKLRNQSFIHKLLWYPSLKEIEVVSYNHRGDATMHQKSPIANAQLRADEDSSDIYVKLPVNSLWFTTPRSEVKRIDKIRLKQAFR